MAKRTALYENHVALKGRVVEFAGWDLPVQYTGLADEHTACRKAAGLFDVSHMGEFFVKGEGALEFINFCVTNDLSKTTDGQAQYTVLCYENGTCVDDLVIYRRSATDFLIVANASNVEKDFAHFEQILKTARSRFPKVTLQNASAEFTQIAVQGPKAEEIVSKLTASNLNEIKTYRFTEGKLLNTIPAIIARTGYTGEDGFELYVPWSDGPKVWNALLEVGTPLGLKPCGLGARDTLRTEMKYPLYGQEISDKLNPLEAGLGWVVKLDKSDFVGKAALLKIKNSGMKNALVGFRLLDRGIPRHDYLIFDEKGNERIGIVTSGTHSPSLEKSVGIGYVPATLTGIGSKFTVDIRGQKVLAEVVKTPFYKKETK